MKAQLSFEFLTWFVVGLLAFGAVWYGSQSFQQRLLTERALSEVRGLCEGLASEINLAGYAGTGYERAVYVPSALYGVNEFSIRTQNYTLLIHWDGTTSLCMLAVERVLGQFKPGQNVLRNLNGIVYVE